MVVELIIKYMFLNSDVILVWVKGILLVVYLDILFKNIEMKGDIFCIIIVMCIYVLFWIEIFIDV